MAQMKIFVYGTLLRDLCRHSCLAGAQYCGPALARVRLYDLGSYPGIRHGDGTTTGELYEISDSLRDTLDGVEEFYPARPEESLYISEPLVVRLLTDGSPVSCESYFYNSPIAEEDLIPHGDYRRYLMEKKLPGQLPRTGMA
jgi:gamma-glutamylcyclotransferase (GGCT)/AIG2-like uncharacterized protein YtfP